MTTPSRRSTSGWVIFSGLMVAIVAANNLIAGATLLINDEWVLLVPEALVVFDFTTVGVTYLIFAALQVFVAMGIFNGDLWARVLGIVAASFNLIAQFAFMSVYPQWAWVNIVICGLIIYGLAVHGDEVAEF